MSAFPKRRPLATENEALSKPKAFKTTKRESPFQADSAVCQICRKPGEEFCSDFIECNFRARRRLGLPLHACIEAKAQDLERAAARISLVAKQEHARAVAVSNLPPKPRNAEYDDYIRSPRWREFRAAIIEAERWRCQECHVMSRELDVHHLTYTRLFFETRADVLVLCPPCHRALHDETAAA